MIYNYVYILFLINWQFRLYYSCMLVYRLLVFFWEVAIIKNFALGLTFVESQHEAKDLSYLHTILK